MNENLGDLVKWQDKAGGWHTGRLVMVAGGDYPVECMSGSYRLVRESCDLGLTWVPPVRLKKWLTRKERGEE